MKRSLLISFSLLMVSCFAGCKEVSVTTQCSDIIYEYVVQVLAMPSCSATVVDKGPCFAKFEYGDGRVFCIGSPGAATEVVQFVATLEKGKTYYLPEAFMKYQKLDKLQIKY